MKRVQTLCAALVSASLLLSAPPVMAAPSVSVGFSPEGSAEQLVLSTINDARESIRLMGYSFTAPEVVKALMAAKRRGVDVKVVLDAKGNDNRSGQAAMALLASAGIPVRTVSAFRIMHDKTLVTDGRNVETGSYNFSRSAARNNSENALLLKDMPSVAQRYLVHWQSRWDMGTDWSPAN